MRPEGPAGRNGFGHLGRQIRFPGGQSRAGEGRPSRFPALLTVAAGMIMEAVFSTAGVRVLAAPPDLSGLIGVHRQIRI